jgi:predicted GIY-YIG superfamily endonuclease
MQRLQFLYLIATGNNDSIYKVGISDDPKRRLEQIKERYGVPNAYIVETMDVPTRQEVVALENAIHTRFLKKRSTRYGGESSLDSPNRTSIGS